MTSTQAPPFPQPFDLEILEGANWVPRSAVVGALIRDLSFYSVTAGQDRLTHVNGIPLGRLLASASHDPGHAIEEVRLEIRFGFPALVLTVWLGPTMAELSLDERTTITLARPS